MVRQKVHDAIRGTGDWMLVGGFGLLMCAVLLAIGATQYPGLQPMADDLGTVAVYLLIGGTLWSLFVDNGDGF